jgi:hypothetical protein
VNTVLEVLHAMVDQKLEKNNPPDTETMSAPF